MSAGRPRRSWAAMARGFRLAVEIREGLVDDEHTRMSREALMKIEEGGANRDPPIRIVGIDHDRNVEAAHVLEPLCFDDASSGGSESCREAAISGRQSADRPARQYVRERLDERLRAGACDHAGSGHADSGAPRPPRGS